MIHFYMDQIHSLGDNLEMIFIPLGFGFIFQVFKFPDAFNEESISLDLNLVEFKH